MISITCLDSKLLNNQNWYSRFQLAPFRKGEALTVANALRRTLLAERSNFYVTWVDFYHAELPYSVLTGMRESIFDILLNLKQIVLRSDSMIPYESKNEPNFLNSDDHWSDPRVNTFEVSSFTHSRQITNSSKKKGLAKKNPSTLHYFTRPPFKQHYHYVKPESLAEPINIGYLCVKGPGPIYAKDIKFPKGLKCINPENYLATLADDGLLILRFAIDTDLVFIKKSPTWPTHVLNAHLASNFKSKLNPLTNKLSYGFKNFSNFHFSRNLAAFKRKKNNQQEKFLKEKKILSPFLIHQTHQQFFYEPNFSQQNFFHGTPINAIANIVPETRQFKKPPRFLQERQEPSFNQNLKTFKKIPEKKLAFSLQTLSGENFSNQEAKLIGSLVQPKAALKIASQPFGGLKDSSKSTFVKNCFLNKQVQLESLPLKEAQVFLNLSGQKDFWFLPSTTGSQFCKRWPFKIIKQLKTTNFLVTKSDHLPFFFKFLQNQLFLFFKKPSLASNKIFPLKVTSLAEDSKKSDWKANPHLFATRFDRWYDFSLIFRKKNRALDLQIEKFPFPTLTNQSLKLTRSTDSEALFPKLKVWQRESPALVGSLKKTCLVNVPLKHEYYKSGCMDRFLVEVLKTFTPALVGTLKTRTLETNRQFNQTSISKSKWCKAMEHVELPEIKISSKKNKTSKLKKRPKMIKPPKLSNLNAFYGALNEAYQGTTLNFKMKTFQRTKNLKSWHQIRFCFQKKSWSTYDLKPLVNWFAYQLLGIKTFRNSVATAFGQPGTNAKIYFDFFMKLATAQFHLANIPKLFLATFQQAWLTRKNRIPSLEGSDASFSLSTLLLFKTIPPFQSKSAKFFSKTLYQLELNLPESFSTFFNLQKKIPKHNLLKSKTGVRVILPQTLKLAKTPKLKSDAQRSSTLNYGSFGFERSEEWLGYKIESHPGRDFMPKLLPFQNFSDKSSILGSWTTIQQNSLNVDQFGPHLSKTKALHNVSLKVSYLTIEATLSILKHAIKFHDQQTIFPRKLNKISLPKWFFRFVCPSLPVWLRSQSWVLPNMLDQKFAALKVSNFKSFQVGSLRKFPNRNYTVKNVIYVDPLKLDFNWTNLKKASAKLTGPCFSKNFIPPEAQQFILKKNNTLTFSSNYEPLKILNLAKLIPQAMFPEMFKSLSTSSSKVEVPLSKIESQGQGAPDNPNELKLLKLAYCQPQHESQTWPFFSSNLTLEAWVDLKIESLSWWNTGYQNYFSNWISLRSVFQTNPSSSKNNLLDTHQQSKHAWPSNLTFLEANCPVGYHWKTNLSQLHWASTQRKFSYHSKVFFSFRYRYPFKYTSVQKFFPWCADLNYDLKPVRTFHLRNFTKKPSYEPNHWSKRNLDLDRLVKAANQKPTFTITNLLIYKESFKIYRQIISQENLLALSDIKNRFFSFHDQQIEHFLFLKKKKFENNLIYKSASADHQLANKIFFPLEARLGSTPELVTHSVERLVQPYNQRFRKEKPIKRQLPVKKNTLVSLTRKNKEKNSQLTKRPKNQKPSLKKSKILLTDYFANVFDLALNHGTFYLNLQVFGAETLQQQLFFGSYSNNGFKATDETLTNFFFNLKKLQVFNQNSPPTLFKLLNSGSFFSFPCENFRNRFRSAYPIDSLFALAKKLTNQTLQSFSFNLFSTFSEASLSLDFEPKVSDLETVDQPSLTFSRRTWKYLLWKKLQRLAQNDPDFFQQLNLTKAPAKSPRVVPKKIFKFLKVLPWNESKELEPPLLENFLANYGLPTLSMTQTKPDFESSFRSDNLSQELETEKKHHLDQTPQSLDNFPETLKPVFFEKSSKKTYKQHLNYKFFFKDKLKGFLIYKFYQIHYLRLFSTSVEADAFIFKPIHEINNHLCQLKIPFTTLPEPFSIRRVTFNFDYFPYTFLSPQKNCFFTSQTSFTHFIRYQEPFTLLQTSPYRPLNASAKFRQRWTAKMSDSLNLSNTGWPTRALPNFMKQTNYWLRNANFFLAYLRIETFIQPPFSEYYGSLFYYLEFCKNFHFDLPPLNQSSKAGQLAENNLTENNDETRLSCNQTSRLSSTSKPNWSEKLAGFHFKPFLEIPFYFDLYFKRKILWNAKKNTFNIIHNFIFSLVSDRKLKSTTIKPLFKQIKVKKSPFRKAAQLFFSGPLQEKVTYLPQIKKYHYALQIFTKSYNNLTTQKRFQGPLTKSTVKWPDSADLKVASNDHQVSRNTSNGSDLKVFSTLHEPKGLNLNKLANYQAFFAYLPFALSQTFLKKSALNSKIRFFPRVVFSRFWSQLANFKLYKNFPQKKTLMNSNAIRTFKVQRFGQRRSLVFTSLPSTPIRLVYQSNFNLKQSQEVFDKLESLPCQPLLLTLNSGTIILFTLLIRQPNFKRFRILKNFSSRFLATFRVFDYFFGFEFLQTVEGIGFPRLNFSNHDDSFSPSLGFLLKNDLQQQPAVQTVKSLHYWTRFMILAGGPKGPWPKLPMAFNPSSPDHSRHFKFTYSEKIPSTLSLSTFKDGWLRPGLLTPPAWAPLNKINLLLFVTSAWSQSKVLNFLSTLHASSAVLFYFIGTDLNSSFKQFWHHQLSRWSAESVSTNHQTSILQRPNLEKFFHQPLSFIEKTLLKQEKDQTLTLSGNYFYLLKTYKKSQLLFYHFQLRGCKAYQNYFWKNPLSQKILTTLPATPWLASESWSDPTKKLNLLQCLQTTIRQISYETQSSDHLSKKNLSKHSFSENQNFNFLNSGNNSIFKTLQGPFWFTLKNRNSNLRRRLWFLLRIPTSKTFSSNFFVSKRNFRRWVPEVKVKAALKKNSLNKSLTVLYQILFKPTDLDQLTSIFNKKSTSLSTFFQLEPNLSKQNSYPYKSINSLMLPIQNIQIAKFAQNRVFLVAFKPSKTIVRTWVQKQPVFLKNLSLLEKSKVKKFSNRLAAFSPNSSNTVSKAQPDNFNGWQKNFQNKSQNAWPFSFKTDTYNTKLAKINKKMHFDQSYLVQIWGIRSYQNLWTLNFTKKPYVSVKPRLALSSKQSTMAKIECNTQRALTQSTLKKTWLLNTVYRAQLFAPFFELGLTSFNAPRFKFTKSLSCLTEKSALKKLLTSSSSIATFNTRSSHLRLLQFSFLPTFKISDSNLKKFYSFSFKLNKPLMISKANAFEPVESPTVEALVIGPKVVVSSSRNFWCSSFFANYFLYAISLASDKFFQKFLNSDFPILLDRTHKAVQTESWSGEKINAPFALPVHRWSTSEPSRIPRSLNSETRSKVPLAKKVPGAPDLLESRSDFQVSDSLESRFKPELWGFFAKPKFLVRKNSNWVKREKLTKPFQSSQRSLTKSLKSDSLAKKNKPNLIMKSEALIASSNITFSFLKNYAWQAESLRPSQKPGPNSELSLVKFKLRSLDLKPVFTETQALVDTNAWDSNLTSVLKSSNETASHFEEWSTILDEKSDLVKHEFKPRKAKNLFSLVKLRPRLFSKVLQKSLRSALFQPILSRASTRKLDLPRFARRTTSSWLVFNFVPQLFQLWTSLLVFSTVENKVYSYLTSRQIIYEKMSVNWKQKIFARHFFRPHLLPFNQKPGGAMVKLKYFSIDEKLSPISKVNYMIENFRVTSFEEKPRSSDLFQFDFKPKDQPTLAFMARNYGLQIQQLSPLVSVLQDGFQTSLLNQPSHTFTGLVNKKEKLLQEKLSTIISRLQKSTAFSLPSGLWKSYPYTVPSLYGPNLAFPRLLDVATKPRSNLKRMYKELKLLHTRLPGQRSYLYKRLGTNPLLGNQATTFHVFYKIFATYSYLQNLLKVAPYYQRLHQSIQYFYPLMLPWTANTKTNYNSSGLYSLFQNKEQVFRLFFFLPFSSSKKVPLKKEALSSYQSTWLQRWAENTCFSNGFDRSGLTSSPSLGWQKSELSDQFWSTYLTSRPFENKSYSLVQLEETSTWVGPFSLEQVVHNEYIQLDIWTNGSINARLAISQAFTKLAALFLTLRKQNYLKPLTYKRPSQKHKKKQLRQKKQREFVIEPQHFLVTSLYQKLISKKKIRPSFSSELKKQQLKRKLKNQPYLKFPQEDEDQPKKKPPFDPWASIYNRDPS